MAHKLKLMLAYGKLVKNSEDLLRRWEAGQDFWSPETRYCSARDLEYLKKEYDYIVITGKLRIPENKDIFTYAYVPEIPVYTGVLAGATNYI